jgi:hypothetical protein
MNSTIKLKDKIHTVFALAFILILLSACSDLPSESDGHDILQQKIQSESKGLIKLVSFRTTDQQQDESEYYILEYEAEIEFMENLVWGNNWPFWDGVFVAVKGRSRGALESFDPKFIA